VLVNPVVAADPVIVGKWDRTDGDDKYTIYADRTTQTVLPDGTHHGTWELDGSSGYKYIFRWDFGPSGRENFIDYVTVAADGKSYSGVNNYGNQFHCVRVGEIDSVPASDSGFPIVPVAIGGGIAAAAIGGAAVYYFVIAGKGAESAASGASSAGTVRGKANEVAMGHVTRGLGTKVVQSPPTKEDGIYKIMPQDPLKPAKDILKQLETQQAPQQNQDNTQNSGNEQPQQEPSDDSPATQEVADSGVSSGDAST